MDNKDQNSAAPVIEKCHLKYTVEYIPIKNTNGEDKPTGAGMETRILLPTNASDEEPFGDILRRLTSRLRADEVAKLVPGIKHLLVETVSQRIKEKKDVKVDKQFLSLVEMGIPAEDYDLAEEVAKTFHSTHKMKACVQRRMLDTTDNAYTQDGIWFDWSFGTEQSRQPCHWD